MDLHTVAAFETGQESDQLKGTSSEEESCSSSTTSSSSSSEESSSENENYDIFDYLIDYPSVVLNRLRALRKLQAQCNVVQLEFLRNYQALQANFYRSVRTLHARREAIVNGRYEPSAEEMADNCFDHMSHALKVLSLNAKRGRDRSMKDKHAPKGVPNFWLNAMRNSRTVGRTIRKWDEPALAALTDVRCEIDVNPPGYLLTFRFERNKFFFNRTLFKRYTISPNTNSNCLAKPIKLGVIERLGSKIKWKRNMNLTKIAQYEMPSSDCSDFNSFFDFFDQKLDLGSGDDVFSTEKYGALVYDCKMGACFRDRIIPRAVLYYTGEAQSSDEEDEDEDDTSSIEDFSDIN